MEQEQSESEFEYEVADVEDVNVLISLQKDLQLAILQSQFVEQKVENVKLRLKIKYNLSDTDVLNLESGRITRKQNV